MSEREEDVRLERELREALGRRDPGPAPYGLRGRVDRVPEETTRRTRREMVARAISMAGAIAAGVAVALVAVGRGRDAGTGAPLGTPTIAADPFGPGVVAYPSIEMFGYGAAVLAFGLAAIGIGLLILRRRGGRIALGLGLLVPAFVATLALMPGVVADESKGTMVAPVAEAQMPAGYGGSTIYYTLADPGASYATELGVRNGGLLPMTVRGFVGRGEFALQQPHWVEVRLIRDPEATSPAEGDPFVPFTLPPGGWMGIRLVGMPGPCAVGSTFDAAIAGTLQYEPVTITVSYDILGWPRADRLSSSYQLLVPYRADCDASAVSSATP